MTTTSLKTATCPTREFIAIPWKKGTDESSSSISLSFSNKVALKENDLAVFPEFVSQQETADILREVNADQDGFVWEGFDQRRKVRRWSDQESLPPTLKLLTERLRKSLSFLHNDDNAKFEVTVEEYPRNQTLRHLSNDKKHVTTFETSNICSRCSPEATKTDRDCCHCFVAVVPLTVSIVENINRPKERSVNCWDLSLPVEHHSGSWVIPQSTLFVKRKDLLYQWRSRIVKILDCEEPRSAAENSTLQQSAVIVKIYNLRKEALTECKGVQSPEFGYVSTIESREEEVRRRSVPRPPIEQLLTILVTTSPIKSNPSTELLERVFDTFTMGGYNFAYKCRKVIICDGARQKDERTTQKYSNTKQAMRHGLVTSAQNELYELFKHSLRRLCEDAKGLEPPSLFTNTTVHDLSSRHGYGFALRHALHECIDTPYVIVIQHDRTFMRPTPIEEALDAMWNNDCVKYTGFSMRSNLCYRDHFIGQYGRAYMDEMAECILRPPELLVDASRYGPNSESTKKMECDSEKLRDNIAAVIENYKKCHQNIEYEEWLETHPPTPTKHQLSLTPTFFWYDNVHICETKHYRDFIFDPRYKMVVKGGFVEDKLSPVIKKTVERLGLTDGHSRFGCYLLDDHSGMFFTGHLDGGSFLDCATREQLLMKKRSSSASDITKNA
jgi:hypothetical protein